jgi:hypothetical protein
LTQISSPTFSSAAFQSIISILGALDCFKVQVQSTNVPVMVLHICVLRLWSFYSAYVSLRAATNVLPSNPTGVSSQTAESNDADAFAGYIAFANGQSFIGPPRLGMIRQYWSAW